MGLGLFKMKDVFCFISKLKFGSLRNPFATITSLPELYLRIRGFILLVQKKVISMNYGSSRSNWKPWRWSRFDLTLWEMYASIPTWTHPQNWLAAAEALTLKMSSHGKSLKWSQRPSQSAWEYSHKLCDETGHPVMNLMESQ